MKAITLLLVYLLMYIESMCQLRQPNVESLISTYNIQAEAATGTCFKIVDASGNELFFTAAHLFNKQRTSAEEVSVRMIIGTQVKTYQAKVFFHFNRNVDVAMLKLPEKVQQGQGIKIKADTTGMFFADEVLFYGFPLSNYGTEAAGLKFPIVKKAIISGQINYEGANVLLLDGHNNQGFSGGPVLKYDAKEGWVVIGIISGYLLEERKAQHNKSDLHLQENSGIILCYTSNYIMDILSTSSQ